MTIAPPDGAMTARADGEEDMAQYAPAGAALLVIGATATAATRDPAFVLLVIVLAPLAYAVGVALVRPPVVDEGPGE